MTQPQSTPSSTGRTNSLGAAAELDWGSFDGASRDEFERRVSNAVPGNLGLVFWGVEQNSAPLLGGTLLVLPPLTRMPPVALDANGAVAIPLSIEPDAVGQTRNYQFWFRDPLHPDGTGSGLTNAVEVPLCN